MECQSSVNRAVDGVLIEYQLSVDQGSIKVLIEGINQHSFQLTSIPSF